MRKYVIYILVVLISSLIFSASPAQAAVVVIKTTALPAGIAGQNYSTVIQVQYTGGGFPVISFDSLPAGLTLAGAVGPANVVYNSLFVNSSDIASITVGGLPTTAGNYQFNLTVSDGTLTDTKAVTINITSSTGQAVTVLSPNGGETWTPNLTVNITWRRNWMPNYATSTVDVFYKNEKGDTGILAAGAQDSSISLLVPTILPPGKYKVAVTSRGATGGTDLTDESDSWITLGSGKDWSKELHLYGTLINDNGTIYVLKPGTGGFGRLAFPSIAVFHSHGYSLANILPANDADRVLPSLGVAKFADGSLVADKGAVYIIENEKKYGFASAEVFLGLGYKFENVYAGDLTDYPLGGVIDNTNGRHSYGTVVMDGSGTVYQMTSNGYSGVPSLAVFQANKFNFRNVVSMSPADKTALAAITNLGNFKIPDGTLVNVGGGIYHIGSGLLAPFRTAQAFLGMGYNFSHPIPISSSELPTNYYQGTLD